MIKSYRQRDIYCHYPPLRLWIEPTNLCNLKCNMCPTPFISDEKIGFMKLGAFKSIIDNVRDYVYDVFLLLRGEPLLHKEISEMIKYCNKTGVRSVIHSNATMLNDRLSESLIVSGLDLISFSFDGYDKASYENIRKGANYEDTISKIIAFLKIKKRLNSKLPYVIIQNILFKNIKYTFADKVKFKGYFSSLPVNEFRDVDSDNRGGFFAEPKNFHTTLTKCKTMSVCPFIWYSLAILWDGKIVPCCMYSGGNNIVGDISDANLLSVWNGQQMLKLRKSMRERALTKKDNCYNCDIIWHKRKGNIPLDFLLSFSEGVIGYNFTRFIYQNSRILKKFLRKR